MTTLDPASTQQLIDAAIGEAILEAAGIALPKLDQPDDIRVEVRQTYDGVFHEPDLVQHALEAYNGGAGRDMRIILDYRGGERGKGTRPAIARPVDQVLADVVAASVTPPAQPATLLERIRPEQQLVWWSQHRWLIIIIALAVVAAIYRILT